MNKPDHRKRSYNSTTRQTRAQETKGRILSCAKLLFQEQGFEGVTIEHIAHSAHVSGPTIYGLFQSKRGILRALMDSALPTHQFESLVAEARQEKTPARHLALSAKIARHIYDAENAQMSLIQGASILAPEFKDLEKEREQRRYTRQEESIQMIVNADALVDSLSLRQARDILWAFTGRDMYRMFVMEQGWTSDAYESWLAQLLINTLLR